MWINGKSVAARVQQSREYEWDFKKKVEISECRMQTKQVAQIYNLGVVDLGIQKLVGYRTIFHHNRFAASFTKQFRVVNFRVYIIAMARSTTFVLSKLYGLY